MAQEYKETPTAIGARFITKSLTDYGIDFIPEAMKNHGITPDSSLYDLLESKTASVLFMESNSGESHDLAHLLRAQFKENAYERDFVDSFAVKDAANALKAEYRRQEKAFKKASAPEEQFHLAALGAIYEELAKLASCKRISLPSLGNESRAR